MKKILGIMVLGLLWCNVAFAAERDWVETDYTISHYLKNDWALTFVTLKNEHKTAFTLQKSKSIIFCRIEGMTREKCYKPKGQQD